MISYDALFRLAGILFGAYAINGALDASNAKRWGNGLFWGLVAVVFLFTRPLISYLSRFRWFSRSRLTGFFGPDGGEPSTGAPRPSLVAPTPQEA